MKQACFSISSPFYFCSCFWYCCLLGFLALSFWSYPLCMYRTQSHISNVQKKFSNRKWFYLFIVDVGNDECFFFSYFMKWTFSFLAYALTVVAAQTTQCLQHTSSYTLSTRILLVKSTKNTLDKFLFFCFSALFSIKFIHQTRRASFLLQREKVKMSVSPIWCFCFSCFRCYLEQPRQNFTFDHMNDLKNY